MTNNNIISDEMIAAVIDGTATGEERRSVYKLIERDEKMQSMFKRCIFVKIFENEIENEFREQYASLTLGLIPEVEIQDKTIFNQIQLSTGNRADDEDYKDLMDDAFN
jgi:hypothetical protein